MDEIIIQIVMPIALVMFLLWFIKSRNKKNQAEKLSRLFIICPNQNCGYRGTGREQGARSGCLLVVLLCLGILPGILYLLFFGKPGIVCPKCGMKIR